MLLILLVFFCALLIQVYRFDAKLILRRVSVEITLPLLESLIFFLCSSERGYPILFFRAILIFCLVSFDRTLPFISIANFLFGFFGMEVPRSKHLINLSRNLLFLLSFCCHKERSLHRFIIRKRFPHQMVNNIVGFSRQFKKVIGIFRPFRFPRFWYNMMTLEPAQVYLKVRWR